MTGDVILTAFDLWEIIKGKFKNDPLVDSFKNESAALGAFLLRGLLGAGEFIGWSAVLLPGVALIIYPARGNTTG